MRSIRSIVRSWVEGEEAEQGTDVTTQSEHRSEHLSSRPTKGREGTTKKCVKKGKGKRQKGQPLTTRGEPTDKKDRVYGKP